MPLDSPTYGQAAIQTNAWDSGSKACSGIITVEGIRKCIWENCTIAHVGSRGLELGIGCQQNQIIDCEFSDLAAGGIRIGLAAIDYKYNDDRLTYDNKIIRCHIYEAGRIFHAAVAIWIGQSHNNLISRNHIHDLFYSGISVGWTWGYSGGKGKNNTIEFNHIHHVGNPSRGEPTFLSDLGGIYILGQQPSTVIRGNLIHDIQALKYGGWGIYLDEGSSQILVEGNLVYRTKSSGFHLHYGKENIIRNNIFAFGKDAQITRSKQEEHLSFTFEQNIIYWSEGKLLEGTWEEWQTKEMDKKLSYRRSAFYCSRKRRF